MCSFTTKSETIQKEVEDSKCVFAYSFVLENSIIQQWQRDVASLGCVQGSKNCGQILLHFFVRTSLVWNTLYHFKCFENQRIQIV